MDDGDTYELDDGELVEVPVGFESQQVAARLFAKLDAFVREHGLGMALPMEVGLQIFPNPRRIPRPDGGFISFERLGMRRAPKGFVTTTPELVVEAVSPGDEAAYLKRKIEEYLSVGVKLVWVLWPDSRSATVYHVDAVGMPVWPDGYLDGEDVLPGFRCALADIMPPPDDDEAQES